MSILDNFIIISLILLAFIAGLKLAGWFYRQENLHVKEALERQFLRLRASADADDPCRPYVAQRLYPQNTGDFDGDTQNPITPEFMEKLKTSGQASTKFRKSDLKK